MTIWLQSGNAKHRMMAVALTCLLPGMVLAQSTAQRDSVPKTAPVEQVAAPKMAAVEGVQMDRAVAIVNGQLILDSDVDQERRFAALLPYGEAAGRQSRDRIIERLIDRALILQQSRIQPQNEVSDADAKKDLDNLRKVLPTCKEFHCETDEGWQKFLTSQGFTEDSLLQLWKGRMEVLAFIEQRFRMGIKISPEEIKTYYDKTLMPQYAAQHATAPPLSSISERIQEVLLQQQVSNLLDDWLKSLKAQGSVVVLHPGEGAP